MTLFAETLFAGIVFIPLKLTLYELETLLAEELYTKGEVYGFELLKFTVGITVGKIVADDIIIYINIFF